MSMRDLGIAEIVGAEAIGEPGQRRFRLFARTRSHSAILWMEKEQLLNLSLVIDRMLAQISEGRILRTEAQAGGLPGSQSAPGDVPVSPDYEFQVGQLRLSFEGERERFVLSAVPFEIEDDEQGEPQLYLHSDDTLSFLFTLEQAQKLTSRITFLVNSGRPVCPLCHTPLDGGPHACVKQNGHREIVQVLAEEEEEDDDE
ncbi:MAG TPA: DUF3090 family protein [Ktedonobacteraceae bacterium]|nr:DUF3090 family protein [Ktedonobacteraceae bacterium]